MRSLYRVCGRQALLPKSLAIPLCYDPMETPRCHGGFGDVWTGQHHGKEVAAKALRVYLTSDLPRIRRVGYPCLVVFVDKPTAFHTEVLQGGRWMEAPSSSERVTAVGRDDDRDPVRDGIGMDGKWEHHPVREGEYQRGPAGACKFLVQGSPISLTLMTTRLT
jgi:hypothetical protein